MSYEFSIGKTTVTLLLTGYLLVAALLFVAGFLLGVRFGLSPQAAEIIARSAPAQAAPASAPSPAAAPAKAPISPPPVNPAPALNLARLTPPAPAAPNAAAITAVAAAVPVRQNTAANAPPAPSPAAASPAADNSSPTAAANPPLTSSPGPAAGGAGYAIQVGAFLDPANAARLAKGLQEEGYKAAVRNFEDSRFRVWHAVRIGPFKNSQAASEGARDLERRQQILAIVRRADAL